VLLGSLVAAAILLARGPSTGDEDRRVSVTGADMMQLRAAFKRMRQREPTASELRGYLEVHIRQEVLYREALARGYDRDDPVVRQAMQRKMEFLASSQGTREPPTDAEIEAFFALRRERYRIPAVLDLAQVYVSVEGDAAAVEARAADLLQRLREEDPDPRALADWGDALRLNPFYTGQTEQDLQALFGGDFATAVLQVDAGVWSGPIRSGYGLHLVKVLERQDGRVPAWTEVRGRVLSDLQYEAGQAAREQLYQEIVQTYQILLDPTVRELLETMAE